VFDDLLAYAYQLIDEGWYVTMAFDLNNSPGSGELAKPSAEAGKALILYFDYTDSGYTIDIQKGEGTVDVQ
jgi:hypothetical protein